MQIPVLKVNDVVRVTGEGNTPYRMVTAIQLGEDTFSWVLLSPVNMTETKQSPRDVSSVTVCFTDTIGQYTRTQMFTTMPSFSGTSDQSQVRKIWRRGQHIQLEQIFPKE